MMNSATAEYSGLAGINFFAEDRLLQAWLSKRLPADIQKPTFARLQSFGQLCGKTLDPLIEAAHRDDKLPKLVSSDRWGRRMDEVVYCPEQLEARKLAMAGGILPPTPLIERMAKAYLLNQNGEGGVTCPLAMTDGLVSLLETHGTEEQKRRYLPLVLDVNGPTPLTGGQFVTERQGGSNVSENEARAVQASDGSWRLTGLKWFCSNPGELWVTTAKPEGSDMVGLFLMPRRMPDGALNECHILRLKDLCGTRGKATAEVEYRGAYAELIGRPSQGIAILLRTVLKTSRIHVAAGALGMMRRAYLEAKVYAESRKVLGRPAASIAAIAQSLARMEERWKKCLLAFFEELAMIEDKNPAAEILIPLLKMKISEAATVQVREAQLIFAGNGILRDFSILTRLSQDALIQEIWEGTHQVLAGHAVKALRRPASRKAFDALVGEHKNLLSAVAEEEDGGLTLCDAAFTALTRSLKTPA